MSKLKFETKKTKESETYSDYVDAIGFILNRLNVELAVSAANFDEPRRQQARVVFGLIFSACTTCENISRLVRELSMSTKDSVSLARTFFDSCQQAAFLMTDDGQLAERVALYSIYKEFKNQSRFVVLGEQKVVVQRHPKIDSSDTLVRRALDIFEPKRGGKPRPCFDVEREQMIAKIYNYSNKAGIEFQGAEALCYATSSEFIHGSFYSFELSKGFPEGDGDPFKTRAELAFIAATTVIISAEALSRVCLVRYPDLHHPAFLIEAAGLFYKETVPELAEELASFYK